MSYLHSPITNMSHQNFANKNLGCTAWNPSPFKNVILTSLIARTKRVR